MVMFLIRLKCNSSTDQIYIGVFQQKSLTLLVHLSAGSFYSGF